MFLCIESPAQETAFDFAQLRKQAEDLAGKEYVQQAAIPENLSSLDYDQYRKILFNTRNETWKHLPFALQFMHLGYFDHDRVIIHEIDGDTVQTIPFSKKYYLYTGNLPESAVDESALNFAGFRILYERKPGDYQEIISFLGASYFRGLGEGENFGLSARGLSINTVPPGAEEFPAFREFWIERPKSTASRVRIFALLDSASATGAYEFMVTPRHETLVQVKASVFARKKVDALGIAPLTSMFWYGGINGQKPLSKNRPAVHDSDGLLIHNGADMWIWHPFSNSPQVVQNYFMDENIRGFGLLQRDRNPGDYKDEEAKYYQRPNAWVEPVGNWGPGCVRLLELHSNDEYTDNVVALWTPAEPLEAGKSIDFEYNLHWSAADPAPSSLLHMESTRVMDSRDKSRRRFLLQFSSGKRIVTSGSDNIRVDVKKKGNIDISVPVLRKTKTGWNVAFETGIPTRPSELDCVLKKGGKIISEKWHYNLQP